jgi:hypothetical protein
MCEKKKKPKKTKKKNRLFVDLKKIYGKNRSTLDLNKCDAIVLLVRFFSRKKKKYKKIVTN